jgi:hypothetical protein
MKEKLKTFVQLPDNLFPKLLINFLVNYHLLKTSSAKDIPNIWKFG